MRRIILDLDDSITIEKKKTEDEKLDHYILMRLPPAERMEAMRKERMGKRQIGADDA